MFGGRVYAGLGPLGGGEAKLHEGAWARTAGAVLHSRNHVQAHEAVRRLRPHLLDHAVVVVDAVERGDGRIVPAVIDDELSSASVEGAEIGGGGVQRMGGPLIGCLHGFIDICCERIPGGILKDHVAEVVLKIVRSGAASGSGAENPWAPPWTLIARRKAREDGPAGRALPAPIQLLQPSHLWRGQAAELF